uniref:Uncharacterized protein n=1 Tax=Plectus sambesii TaxID=2011161 RepID=A0A914VZF3_9BILA
MSLKFFSGLQDFLGLYDSSVGNQHGSVVAGYSSNNGGNSTGASNHGGVNSHSAPVTPKRSLRNINLEDACASTSDDKLTKCSHDRYVHFPDGDSVISGYMEPKTPPFRRPQGQSDTTSPRAILEAYSQACRRMKINPCPKVERQIGFLHNVPNVRQEALSMKGERVTHHHMDCLEEIFRVVQFDQLDFEYTFLDDETAVALAELLEYYDSAVKLNLSFNQHIGLRGWQAIFRMLKNSPCLQTINLRYTSLNERSIPILARALRTEPTLTCLHLENCALTGKSMLLLVCALKANTTLRELYLGENSLGPNDGAHLYQLITGNTGIQMLDLRNNQLQDTGLRHICDALRDPDCSKNGSLSALVLWNNRLTSASMDSLGRALLENTKLETLNIGCNNLSSEGMQHLKNALVRNRTLQRLGLQATKLSCQSAIVLAECIADNPTLVRVDLRDNPDIKSAGLLALHLAMRINTGITSLNLDKACCQTASSKVKEYSEQFKEYYDEILEFCDRNRLNALQSISVQSVEEEDADQSVEKLSEEEVKQSEEHTEEGIKTESVAPTAVDTESEVKPAAVKKKKGARPRFLRSSSLTCTETIADLEERIQQMPSQKLPSLQREKPRQVSESSDDEGPTMPVTPVTPTPPTMTPIHLTITQSPVTSPGGRFSVTPSPCASPQPSPSSPRFQIAAVRPGSLAVSASRKTAASGETPEQISTIVKSVVADLVNFSVYEVGDHAYTPSVSKSMRSLLRDFSQEDVKPTRPSIEIQFAQDDRTAFSFTDSQATTTKSTDENVVLVVETDAERDQAVQQTVRELIKGVIITERDTLRRSVRKKRDRLSKVFTIEPTNSTE